MNELIKEIRNDLRTLKNQWVFKTYNLSNFEIRTKRFNNWFQVFDIINKTGIKKSIHFCMEMKQKEVIDQIIKQLEIFKTQDEE